MPTVSFVVIAYNVERYIADCLQSLQNQTNPDFEVVVVDDASTDSTKSVIESAIQNDSRFSLIAKDKNEGAHLARRTGVSHATGKYVVFVDGDDRLQDTACEVLSSYASGRNFDILRFGRTVVPHGSANQDTALQEERSFNLHTEDMHGEDVLRSVFSEDFGTHNTWSLIDCMFNGEFVRSGFAATYDEPLGRMQDSYEFFVLASRAKTMRFFMEYRGLRYNLGAGVSGSGLETLQKFEHGHTGIHSSMNAVLRYAADSGDDNMTRCAQWYRHVVLGIVGREWVMRLTETDQIAGMRSLRRVWGDENTAYMLLDPLTARAQWFVDHDAVPSDADPCRRWLTLLNSLDLNGISDTVIQQRVNGFLALKGKLDKHEFEIKQAKIAEQQERYRQQLQLEEQRRVLKTGTPIRRVVDAVFPEGSERRNLLRRAAHWILHR